MACHFSPETLLYPVPPDAYPLSQMVEWVESPVNLTARPRTCIETKPDIIDDDVKPEEAPDTLSKEQITTEPKTITSEASENIEKEVSLLVQGSDGIGSDVNDSVIH